MNVTFKHQGAHLASSRYRAIIPAQQLRIAGVKEGKDWLVIGKHGFDYEKESAGFSMVCFDICDDHFSGPHSKHYLECSEKADKITCNSHEMARVILEKTGRQATVIPDPYEQSEYPPRIHDRLLWFGHQSNLSDLIPWLGMDHEIEIVSGIKATGVTQWSPEIMNKAFDRAGLVIIPTGKSMAKSGNRAIESIRRGLFVVAGYLPAYSDLGIYIGNISDGVEWALSHQNEVLERIKASQEYISEEYSPKRIGDQWMRALL